MSWIPIVASGGQRWQVSQDGLYLMARASARAALAKRHTREIRTGTGWFDGPEVTEVSTDWGKVNRQTAAASQTLYNTLAGEVMNHPANTARNLALIFSETRSNQNYLRQLQQRVVGDNMENISRHVSRGQDGVAAATFIRNTAWTTLIVLSAVPTGGASGAASALSSGARVGWLSLGSAGRGQATYQDTGNVGEALVSGAGSFITGAIGLGPGPNAVLSGAEQAVLLGVQSASAGTAAGLQSLVHGDSVETAALQAVTAAGFNFGGGAMSSSQAFGNLSLPVQVSIQIASDMLGNLATDAVGDEPSGGLTIPRTRGRLIHSGIPSNASQDRQFIRSNVLRSL